MVCVFVFWGVHILTEIFCIKQHSFVPMLLFSSVDNSHGYLLTNLRISYKCYWFNNGLFCSGKLHVHVFTSTYLWVNGSKTVWSNWANEPYVYASIIKYYGHTLFHDMIYIYDTTLSLINGVLLHDTIVNLVSHYTFNTIFNCLNIMLCYYWKRL